MLNLPNPKTMAKALRGALAERDIALSHAQCLDLVARQLGFADWNVLAARQEKNEAPSELAMPRGWFAAGHSNPKQFRMGIAPGEPGVAIIEAIEGVAIASDMTGVLMQSIGADAYRGGRVRLSAELATRGADLATLWLRADPPGGGRHLAFDNLIGREEGGPLRGDSDWTQRAVVLDIPEAADSLHFGFLLRARGSVRARGFVLERVGPDVPVTNQGRLPPKPTNLGFE